MITCKVGISIINCFDNAYDKHKLKEWSDRNLLICPDCGKPYEYCHGDVVSPYFRHKEKSQLCDKIYSESETEEHIKGKLILYNWLLELQSNNIVQNVKLESYIPETKQRPDIYFEQDGKRCVIEFQCTPIATEYLKRHELYQLAGVYDIWILGMNKYNLHIDDLGGVIFHTKYYKTIEKHASYYLDSINQDIYFNNNIIESYLQHKKINFPCYLKHNITDFTITNFNFILKQSIIDTYILKNNYDHMQKLEDDLKRNKEIESRRNIVLELNDNVKFYKNLEFTYNNNEYSDNKSYQWKINFTNGASDFVFFIKGNSVDFCRIFYINTPYWAYNYKKHKSTKRWGKSATYHNINTIVLDNISCEDIKEYILNKISLFKKTYAERLKENKILQEQKIKKFRKMFYEFLDREIIFVVANKNKKIDENIRFKYLKGFEMSDKYMEEYFLSELEFLYKKHAKKYIFMVSGYYILNHVVDFVKSYGFTNIKNIDD